MKIEGSDLVFESTGRRLYANGAIVGIDPELQLTEGYDTDLLPHFDDESDRLNEAERVELADHMIERWQAFKRGETRFKEREVVKDSLGSYTVSITAVRSGAGLSDGPAVAVCRKPIIVKTED